ncbi:PREDICTED: serine/threonine-protein kinase ATM isoform X3 [Ipomoea nil]|uniref:serine/threonine-protein kinase ATM isoform X3 n=1 Tax=Ipomoea nil TaxID=35883 RepID=UPI000900DBEC|nr:PREDICTED: serine/threonine-protein kinase ATM isoform X3 [Ipomoea nil]
MASKVTSRDIQEIVSKLSSDKAKLREEGIKLLNTWLEGERSIGFCKYIAEKTAMLKPKELPHSETWPFLIELLMKCVLLEISSSKKRPPKLTFAKTLRIVVQRAEDPRFSGKALLLLPVVKLLFKHVCDVLMDVPSFQSEYSTILRDLLAVRHYGLHMRKRAYCSLVLFYMEKVQTSLSAKLDGQLNPKDEIFRCILTLHSLLENPPGDFPDDLREHIIVGFTVFFTHIRDEGKVSRKLIECINSYLLIDGPNLGCKYLEIHKAVQQFVFRCWTTTHDRSLKDSIVFYARLQLNLTRGATDGGALLEQVLDVMGKELDQMNSLCNNFPWKDTIRDEKYQSLTSSQCSIMELAALVFCRACVNTSKAQLAEKRARREHAVVQIKDGLMSGKWSWHAAFCYLIHNYYTRIKRDVYIYWLENICANFERIVNDANTKHIYDGLLWTLRSLQGLSCLLLFPVSGAEMLSQPPKPIKCDKSWHMIWSCLIHGLPTFSTVPAVVDAALLLLGNIILSDTINAFIVPQDLWDLRFFKRLPSTSVLYFISCYFSRRGSQSDLKDVLYLRQSLLRAVLALPFSKESFVLNEQLVAMLPAAVYVLCVGYSPLPRKGFISPLYYVPEAANDTAKVQEYEDGCPHEFFECSVGVLAKIGEESGYKDIQSPCHQSIRLPRQVRDPLCHEMQNYILEAMNDNEFEGMLLSDVIFICALLSNFMYNSYITGITENVTFLSNLGQYLLKFLDHAISIMEKTCDDIICCNLGSISIFNSMEIIMVSFSSFFHSPLFGELHNRNGIDVVQTSIIQSIERLLKTLAKLYEGCTNSGRNLFSQPDPPAITASGSVQDSHPLISRKSVIIDMELDMDTSSKDADIVTFDGKASTGIAVSPVHQRMEIISLLSKFFLILPVATWDILFDLLQKESDPRVREKIIQSLCQHAHWSSSRKFLELVASMSVIVDMQADVKLPRLSILASICTLLQSLLSLDTVAKDNSDASCLREKVAEQGMISLRELVSKMTENDSFHWRGRTKQIDCICNFILLDPQVGQSLIEKLLLMLRDNDYRVRFFLAQRIGVLFQTWDGHFELFQDICSNFGVKLVICSRERLVTANDVLAAGPQPHQILETTIITLMHLVLQSEKIELEYLEELIGPILFCWVYCGVSLAALVEVRDLFVLDAEPTTFIHYCCHWLLPALILHGDASNLNWIAKIVRMPPPAIVRNHFVQIFSVCMALHCSKNPEREKGSTVLESSILKIAEMSENERDKLIKKQMVSIVSNILSLASCASDPVLPFFSRDTIVRAIVTVVDGFLEMNDSSRSFGVIDKINIFRPDRVFMLIVELHYKIATAAHCRHKCNRLAGIEVLIDVLENRAAVSSTLSYLLNLVGLCIGIDTLLDQCCSIISSLLKIFKINQSEGTTGAIGEQLQFLVSKLVKCCIPSDRNHKHTVEASSKVLLLLHQLTLDAHPSLYEYIKELEPFPCLEIFEGMRRFHEKLCQDYSPRDHLLKLANRSHWLPPRLLVMSLKALHWKLFAGGTHQGQNNDENIFEDVHLQHSDNEIVSAVWDLFHTCSSDDTNNFGAFVSDFVSRVGIGDPHSVVFHLPGESRRKHIYGNINADGAAEHKFHLDSGISEELVIALLKLLKKYLMDDSVKIIDIASQALRGILSTEKGRRCLLSFGSYQRLLMEVHSKGFNLDVVQKLVSDLERKYNAEATSLESSTLWSTDEKTFETWICPLVHALIGYCNDTIIRLCQEIVLVKSEVAELLFPEVITNLSRRTDVAVDLGQLICTKVQESIFTGSNKLTKSIQVVLEALNVLRLCHVTERAISSSTAHKQENLKQYSRPSSYGSRSRSAIVKVKDQPTTSSGSAFSTLLWDKVYWLPIDYLVVAKFAITSGAYFSALLYVEYWCKERFSSLTLGNPDFSHLEILPEHIEILVSAVTQINEPDSLYGIIQCNKLSSQILTCEHEGNWSKALEYYDLQIRSEPAGQMEHLSAKNSQSAFHTYSSRSDESMRKQPLKGLIRSLQQIGCTHLLDVCCQWLTSQKGQFEHDPEFTELQYEAAWRAGNWDFSLLYGGSNTFPSVQDTKGDHFNENLHSCLRALQEGDFGEFHTKLRDSKQELLLSIYRASEESTKYIYLAIVKIQIIYHLGMAWDLRWPSSSKNLDSSSEMKTLISEPVVPSSSQLSWLVKDSTHTLKQAQLHMDLLEPFIAFRRVLLQILKCTNCTVQHLLESASTLRKGSRFSQATSLLHEFKSFCAEMGEENSNLYWLGRLEEAKLLRAQGQHQAAINLAKYIAQNYQFNVDASDVFRLIGKWLAETRSSNSRTILEKYLKHAVNLAEDCMTKDKESMAKRSQMRFHLAHYADALFRSYEDRLNSSEWQAAMRLRKHKKKELEALARRLKTSSKGEKVDYSMKIQELQKQLAMDKEEAAKLQEDRDNFLNTALDEYKRCLVIGDKYDVRVVFRLVSLWFNLSTRSIVVDSMLSTTNEVQSYKFVPLVYQIASRMGNTKDGHGPQSFQFALVSLVKKLAIDHPYHTIFQLLALANGDRIKDKQRSKNSFVVDIDKKVAAENLLKELSSYHGAILRQMKQMVEIYIKLAELETKREDTNKKVTLPRDIRSVRELELVPVITANVPIDPSCLYSEGSFPHFKGLTDSVTIMNGINAPKVVVCLGSDGNKYRQLAKSGNDDLRQDAVMEQFFGLVNTFLQNHRDTWKRRLRIRTYKVVPFTPSAGVLEWVNGTVPLGEYLIGSTRDGGAHGRYGVGDWTFLKCRQYMVTEHDKRKAFQEVCDNYRPVMHHFFLERFLHPADWFEKRLAYTRSVAASSMVGYIVGLGDRHLMNILVDQTTAEVVHIDLGVAFEQGLMLKTPERVPFRLTRDIIDGMGITGVEGVFRRCCEETLSVMRTNKEALLTIVEVFIHDPLYKWALSPLKALQRQKDIDEDLETSLEGSQEDEYEGNKDAARALMRVKQKLDGYEEGELRSVHGQVQQLIQDATDPDRLCHMFPGWGAWL